MSWIKIVSYEEAVGKLKSLYDRVKGPQNKIDNILQIHSLRPHSLEGHMVLYKNVLHHRDNTLPKWFLENLGVFVSHLNRCDYCVQHHFAGMKRLLNDEKRSQDIWDAITQNSLDKVYDAKQLAAFEYAQELTQYPEEIKQETIQNMRDVGWEDGEILEINQVVSYFAYANRTVQGLGVNTKGDILGLSPNGPEDNNWSHH